MNNNRITNPNNKEVRDCKSRTTKIVTGNYTGKGVPSSSSLSGGSLYQNVGAGFMNCGAGQDIDKNRIGSRWNTRSIGVSLGTKTAYGGSAGVSITTPPLKF